MNSSQRIFNKMAIFRRWKFQSRHKKLTEEWALATSMKDLSDTNDLQDQDEPNQHQLMADEKNTTKFTLKYLGRTSIDAERSQNATAEAIKSVITNAKAIRNSKKPQRVHLTVCPKGVEMKDAQTNDILLRVSIYKISYCSADAAHDHVFAFIGSEDDKNTGEEKLSCYVFLCPKRRIAHDVTLTVAKCFENAYQNWRNSIDQKMFDPSLNEITNCGGSSGINKKKFSLTSSSSIDGNKSTSLLSTDTFASSQDSSTNDLLIDLSQDIEDSSAAAAPPVTTTTALENNTVTLCQKDSRNYLQNTWVSFEDDQTDMGRPLFHENSSWDAQLVF